MGVREGYKQTEVGVIPDGWDAAPLSSIARVTSGKRLPLGYLVVDRETPHPYIRVSDMRSGWIDAVAIKYVPEEAFRLIQNYRIFKDELFISVAGTLGLVGKVPAQLDGANLTENANRISEISCDPDFLLNVMLSPVIQRVIEGQQTVGAQPKLVLARIRNFLIPLPPTAPEQRAIAEALSDVDALLSGLDRLIAKKRDLKQAAMQQLLTGQTRLPGFRGEWEVKRLGDVANIKTGSRNNEDKVDDGSYPFFVRSETIQRINSYSYDCEAILVPGEGRIGEIFHYIKGRFDVHQRVYAITEFEPSACATYIYFWMTMRFGVWAMQNTVKATVDSLRLPTFQNFEYWSPPTLDEQAAIAQVLSDMDAELAALETRCGKTRQLKQGMMQELLTGRTRLV